MPPCETPQSTTNAEYTWEEIKKHNKENDAWVVMDGAVFNVSAFMRDHPGGSSIVLPHLGGDIGDVFEDDDIHVHSDSAHNILLQYKIGLVAGEWGKGKKLTERTAGKAKVDIDWTKPIIFQVGKLGQHYNEFVHDPKVMDEPARFFESDFFELFSRTSWWVIPSTWLPVIVGMTLYSIHLGMSLPYTSFVFVCGFFVWSFLEYCLHRFLFHLDEWVQFSWWTITAHFLMHGVHHKLPQDPMRLVMPPIVTIFLLTPIHYSFRMFLPLPEAVCLTAGGLLGYICYDLTHYYLHHSGIPPLSYLGSLKRYHLAHHYKNPKLGYGITSKFWDVVFGTLLPADDVKIKSK